MFCRNCGKELENNANVCPYCGVPTNSNVYIQGAQEQKNSGSNTLAIVGFIFALTEILSLIGLFLSIAGLKKCKKEGAPLRGLAIAGITLNAIFLSFLLLTIVIPFVTLF